MPKSLIHILWINLVTDSLPALALAVDPAAKDVMERKPEKHKGEVSFRYDEYITARDQLNAVASYTRGESTKQDIAVVLDCMKNGMSQEVLMSHGIINDSLMQKCDEAVQKLSGQLQVEVTQSSDISVPLGTYNLTQYGDICQKATATAMIQITDAEKGILHTAAHNINKDGLMPFLEQNVPDDIKSVIAMSIIDNRALMAVRAEAEKVIKINLVENHDFVLMYITKDMIGEDLTIIYGQMNSFDKSETSIVTEVNFVQVLNAPIPIV